MSQNTMNVETLTLDGAKLAADAALATADDEGLAVCVAVVNATGNLVLVHRMDNVVEIALENAIAKAVAALTFKRDTGELSDYFQKGHVLGSAHDRPPPHPGRGGRRAADLVGRARSWVRWASRAPSTPRTWCAPRRRPRRSPPRPSDNLEALRWQTATQTTPIRS